MSHISPPEKQNGRLNPIILTRTPYVNVLNKNTHYKTELKIKQYSTTCSLQDTHFSFKDTKNLKKKDKDTPCKQQLQRGRVAILIVDRRDFKTKAVISDKEEYFMIKEPISQRR